MGDDVEQTKIQVNTALYPLVRGTMTMDEFERLTCDVLGLLVEANRLVDLRVDQPFATGD